MGESLWNAFNRHTFTADYFRDLSKDAQDVYLCLILTNPHRIPGFRRGHAASVHLDLEFQSPRAGWTRERVEGAFAELIACGAMDLDPKRRLIWLPLVGCDRVYTPGESNLEGYKIDWEQIQDCPLKARMWLHLQSFAHSMGWLRGFTKLVKPQSLPGVEPANGAHPGVTCDVSTPPPPPGGGPPLPPGPLPPPPRGGFEKRGPHLTAPQLTSLQLQTRTREPTAPEGWEPEAAAAADGSLRSPPDESVSPQWVVDEWNALGLGFARAAVTPRITDAVAASGMTTRGQWQAEFFAQLRASFHATKPPEDKARWHLLSALATDHLATLRAGGYVDAPKTKPKLAASNGKHVERAQPASTFKPLPAEKPIVDPAVIAAARRAAGLREPERPPDAPQPTQRKAATPSGVTDARDVLRAMMRDASPNHVDHGDDT